MVLTYYGAFINKEVLPEITRHKCLDKGIVFQCINDLFADKLMTNAREEWEFWLQDIVVPHLPDVDVVLGHVRQHLSDIFCGDIKVGLNKNL